MKLELTGKRVLVTGSSKGIGRAIATRFLDEGSSVVITSRGEENLTQLERHLKSEYGDSKVLAKMCDCSDLDSLESLKKKINKTIGIVNFNIKRCFLINKFNFTNEKS